MTTESEAWRSLHPASVLVNLVPTAWRSVRSLWPLAIAMFWGQRAAFVDALILSVFIALPVWRTVLHFLTFRYRVDSGRLELRSGLLNRQVRVIPPERIQNVELVRNVFHRLSGLVEVRVETASGGDVEGQLSALSVQAADELMAALDAHRAAPAPSSEAEALVQHGFGDLLKYGLSSVQLGLVAVALGVGYELSIADPMRAQEGAERLGWAGGSAALLLIVSGAWLLGSARAIVRHWGFTLSQRGDRLVAQEGLLTQRSVELSTRRVQAISFQEPLLRRLLGFGSLTVDTAATREGAGGTHVAEAVIPVLPPDEAETLIQRLFPRTSLTGALHPPHPKALIRTGLASSLFGLIVGTLGTLAFGLPGLVGFLLVPLLLVDAWFDHSRQGWRVGNGHIVSRMGWLNRTTQIVPVDKLQSLAVVQSWFAANWGLAQLRVRAAGTAVRLPWMAMDDALELELELASALTELLAERAVALDDHPDACDEQHPRDGLGDDAHQEQEGHQDPLPREPIAGVAPADAHRTEPDPQDQHGPDDEGAGQGGG